MMLLNEARRFATLGWASLPVTHTPKEKSVALRKWEHFQSIPPTDADYRRWFAKRRVGIAILCGQVSGGLTVRDFDTMDAYQRWAASHPDLAATLPTVATRRGCHVYFRSNFRDIVKVKYGGIEEGELRGKGIVIAPPSRHPSGTTYQWLIQPYPDIPHLDPVAAGLMPEYATWDTRGHREDSGRTQENSERTQRDSAAPDGATANIQSFDATTLEAIDRAIRSSLPTGEGQRHRQVFKLCRNLKGIPELADLRAGALRAVVKAWHTQAVEFIKTKSFDETWCDFVDGWRKVKFPRGAVMAGILKRAKEQPPPKEAARYDTAAVRLLVALCYELQMHAGRKPFFLSARMAEELLGEPRVQANRWMQMLQEDEVLVLVELGTLGGKASQFYYNGE